jgi:hypothetical protein
LAQKLVRCSKSAELGFAPKLRSPRNPNELKDVNKRIRLDEEDAMAESGAQEDGF